MSVHDRSLARAITMALAAMAAHLPAADAADVCALLQRQTQAFSDAGQSGNAVVLDRLLDPDVVFVNETGELATKQDMVTGAGPPPKGISVTMAVMDWRCAVHGATAVTSFIDDQAVAGRPVHTQFRSVETWLRQGATWRMIGSETLTLPIDPPAITLPDATLAAYVGTYTDPSGITFTFTRTSAGLLASANGGPATPQKAELADIFFTPGHGDARKIFQRDKAGAVTGFVYVRGGHDLVFRRQ